MQRLEVSCAVRLIYTSLGAKGLVNTYWIELNWIIKCSWMDWRGKPRWCPYIAVVWSGLEWMASHLQTHLRYSLNKMLFFRWYVVCVERFQYILNLRQGFSGVAGCIHASGARSYRLVYTTLGYRPFILYTFYVTEIHNTHFVIFTT